MQETVELLRDTAIEKIEETRDPAREGVDRGRRQCGAADAPHSSPPRARD